MSNEPEPSDFEEPISSHRKVVMFRTSDGTGIEFALADKQGEPHLLFPVYESRDSV